MVGKVTAGEADIIDFGGVTVWVLHAAYALVEYDTFYLHIQVH